MNEMFNTEFPEEIYRGIAIQDLILFGIYSVVESGETCTIERLIAECFQKFPKVFGFKRYPQWPDQIKFDRPYRTLRKKGLIVGSPRDRFELTEFGKKKAKEIETRLNNGGVTNNKKTRLKARSVDDKLIEYVKESAPFKKFLVNTENFAISESDFRSLLRCTLETPERVIKQNLEYYKNVASSYNEGQILKFLLACEKRFIRRGRKNG